MRNKKNRVVLANPCDSVHLALYFYPATGTCEREQTDFSYFYIDVPKPTWFDANHLATGRKHNLD